MSSNALDHFLAEHERLSPVLGQDSFTQQRQSALEQFAVQGIPHRRMENWKYTSLSRLNKFPFSMQESFSSLTEEQLQDVRFSDMDCYELVFVNGIFAPEYSSKTWPDDCILMPLTEAIQQHGDRIQVILNQQQGQDSFNNSFLSLNTAFLQQGVFIDIANNVELDKPVHLIYLSGLCNTATASHPRNIYCLGKNAKATVIESFIGLDDSDYFTNNISNIVLQDNAELEHYKVQEEGEQGIHISALYSEQAKDSRLYSHAIDLGGLISRNDIFADMNASGSSISMNGLYMVHGKQHMDNHSLVNHKVANTYSDQTYRGIANGHGRAVFNGKVIVHKDAQKTEAHQSNANLLLSDNAEVDTKPELEIYADDVKCSHGATIGQLDKNMLFYLRSRAIDEETAMSLLTFAFAEEVIKKIRFTPIQRRLEQTVIGRLPDSELIQEFTDE